MKRERGAAWKEERRKVIKMGREKLGVRIVGRREEERRSIKRRI